MNKYVKFTKKEKQSYLKYKLYEAKLLKIPGALGVLDEIAEKVFYLKKDKKIRGIVSIFLGDSGVEREGVSNISLKVEHNVFKKIATNNAPINIICRHSASLNVFDVGTCMKEVPRGIYDYRINKGTRNIHYGNAMTEEEMEKCLQTGRVIAKKYKDPNFFNILMLGEMGIGNTTIISIICCLILKLSPTDVCDIGSGISNRNQFKKKYQIIENSVEKFRRQYGDVDKSNIFKLLYMFGCYEVIAEIGFILEAKHNGDLIIVDGAITATAVLAASILDNKVENNIIFSHMSDEKAGQEILKHFKRKAILDLRMRMGEGTGAALCFNVIKPVLEVYFKEVYL